MAPKPDNPAEPFKKALAEATRAMADDQELAVTYSVDPPGMTNDAVRLPQVSRRMTRDEVMQARGAGDAYALRLRFHDGGAHAKYMPQGDMARSIFEAMETARCEAIGAKAMPGVGDNLDARLAESARRMGYGDVRQQADAPLAEAAGFLVRALATGRELPSDCDNVLELWRGFMEQQSGETFEDVCGNLEDQAAFARLARQVIDELGYGEQLGDDPDQPDEGEDEDDEEGQEPQPDESQGEEGGDEDQDSAPDEQSADSPDASAAQVAMDEADETDMTDEAPADDGEPPEAPPRPAPISDADPGYKVFAQKFDEEVSAEDLAEPEELERLRGYLDQQLEPLKGAVGRLANKLQRRLQAQQNRSWEFDQEEGILDAARLARVVSNPTTPLSFKV
ncbi:MAG: cobaltochelatase subunit CobT, partial [Pseudomonadota bacterium]